MRPPFSSAVRRFGRSVILLGSLDGPHEPVFHAHGAHEKITGPFLHGWERRTRCGRIAYKATWGLDDVGQTVEGSYNSFDRAKNVHTDHAIKFARPCHQCWATAD